MTDFTDSLAVDSGQDARTIHFVSEEQFEGWRGNLSPRQQAAVAAHRFTGSEDDMLILPGSDAESWDVVAGGSKPEPGDPWRLARLAGRLPAGNYRLEGGVKESAALGWMLAAYRFDRFRSDVPDRVAPTLLVENERTCSYVLDLARAQAKVRDLVNLPAESLGPADLEAEARTIAEANGAEIEVITGDALLEKNYPTIHAVGRAAAQSRAPRLIRLSWGGRENPRVTLVGKGVTFDSGGLDVKSAAGMRLMKKDMGGAAHALALADLVMRRNLKVRLEVYVPAVENSVSGDALRPGDVVKTRSGQTVEIHNTDAEGRLILCDALTRAYEDEPELLLDFATLTGAARVALGPDLPAMFARKDETADALLAAGTEVGDPVWRLPLWAPYQKMLHSDLADFANAATGGFAGAVTAALYLARFVPDDADWVHLDTFAWMPSAKPGRPKGGEALGLRAAFSLLEDRYGTSLA